MASKVVEYTDSLLENLGNRSYEGTVKSMRKICEEVLGYKKIADRALAEEEGVLEQCNEFIKPMVSEIQSMMNDPELNLPSSFMGSETGFVLKYNRQMHYGNSLPHNPEGVLANLYHKVEHKINIVRNNTDFKPLAGITSTPSINSMLENFEGEETPIFMAAYGERWWDKGNIIDAKELFGFKIPRDVKILSYITVDDFVEEVRKL